jgi:hypothetical protein
MGATRNCHGSVFEIIHPDYEFTPSELVYPPEDPEKALALDELQVLRRNRKDTVPIVLADKTVIEAQIPISCS